MKKTIFLLIILFVSNYGFSQTNDTIFEVTDIKKITVYLVGADISATKSVTLKAGRNVVVFNNLTTKLNSQTIRVSTVDEGAAILNVSYKINRNSDNVKDPDYVIVKDSIKLINSEISALNNKKTSFETEKNLLSQNMNLGGTDKGVDVAQLKIAADFYRTRILEITNGLTLIQEELMVKNENLRLLNQKQTKFTSINEPYGQVIALIQCDKAKKVIFDLQYQVSDAGWSPAYDIRASDLTKPIELFYRANVYNNTNIDWDNVNLVLSTADPSVSKTQPTLQPWYLNFDTYTDNSKSYDWSSGEGRIQNAYVPQTNSESYSLDNNVEQTISFKEVEVTSLNAEFPLSMPYSIPSDNLPYLVDITDYELPATYEHFAVSKMIKDVYLLAKITGWEDLNLVEGKASLFYDGTYIGESYINTRNVEDTLDLSLGVDNKVLVTRTKIKEYSSKQFIGNKISETFVYEIVAKNNRTTPIDIEILDQIPISQSNEIEVEVVEISKAKKDEATGELKWKLNLESGASEKIKISYIVKYPKNKSVEIEQSKKQKMRLF